MQYCQAIMNKILIFTAIYILQLISAQAESPDRNAYCFRFTWRKFDPTSNNAKLNCSMPTPCVEPLISTGDLTTPNVTDLWYVQYANTRSQISCPLSPGYSCIKYTYNFNNAVLNTTYFCGKMIEDKTSAIDSGCYTQKVDGHVIEACACTSNGGQMPCNSSTSIHRSLVLIIISVAMVFILTRVLE